MIYRHFFPAVFLLLSSASWGQTLNLNRIANANLVERNVYDCPYANGYCQYSLKVIHTGKYDFDGNEVLNIKLYYTGKYGDDRNKETIPDSILFVPDFDMYPFRYVMTRSKEYELQFTNDNERLGAFFPSYAEYYLVDSKNATLTPGWASGTSGDFIENYFVPFKGAQNKDIKSLKAYYTDEELVLTEWKRRWEAVARYQDEQLTLAMEKGYDALMAELDGQEMIIIRFGWANMASSLMHEQVKVSFKKDDTGALTTMILQLQYKYGKYSDKPEYFVEIKKDATGMFLMEHSYANGTRKGYLIPFDGRVFICNTSDQPTQVKGNKGGGLPSMVGALTPDLYDWMVHNVLAGKRVYPCHMFKGSSASMDHLAKIEDKKYKELEMEKAQSTSYSYHDDKLNFDVFLKGYIEALKK